MPATSTLRDPHLAYAEGVRKVHGGRVYFVGDTSAALGISASDEGTGEPGTDTYGVTWQYPFATLGYAKARCVANRGDTVYILPGTAISVTAAAGLDLDCAGMSVIGLGNASNRPTITFTTATTADIDIDAANIRIENVRFVAGIDELAAAIDVNAAGFQLVDCEFQMCDTDIQTVIALTCGSNDLLVQDCYFHARALDVAADTAAKAIVLTGTPDNCVIQGVKSRMRIHGNFGAAVGAIDITGAATNVLVRNLFIHNTLATSSACIDTSSQVVTGLFDDLLLRVDDNASVAPIVGTTNGLYTLNNVFVINNNLERGLVVGTASA